MSKGKKPISPRTLHAILGSGKMKNEREIVEEKEETEGSQPCKRKWLTEVLKKHPHLHQQRQIHATHSTIEHKTEQKSAKTA